MQQNKQRFLIPFTVVHNAAVYRSESRSVLSTLCDPMGYTVRGIL